MAELIALAGIVAALSVGVVSPGPSFVMAISSSRVRARSAALGMGVGGVIFAAGALLGLQGVLLAMPALYVGLKVLGGLYLCYLGYLIFRSAKAPLAVQGVSRSQDGHRVCKRVRGVLAYVIHTGLCRNGGSADLLHRGGVVLPGRAAALVGAASARLSLVQKVGRSGGRSRDVRAGRQARHRSCQALGGDGRKHTA
jgi:hypothetical protein